MEAYRNKTFLDLRGGWRVRWNQTMLRTKNNRFPSTAPGKPSREILNTYDFAEQENLQMGKTEIKSFIGIYKEILL